MMRGADVLVDMLIRHGVEVVFGVPGDTSMAFHDALYLRREEIRHVVCRDERSAAYSADAYARISGRIGVVEVPSGGGALYVVPGLSEANVSNIPLLCIASEINMSSDETGALTDCNQEALFSAVTKWNWKLKNTASIPFMTRKAMRKSTTGIPGATALSFPENILREAYTGPETELYAVPGFGDREAYRAGPSAHDLAAFQKLFSETERPVILAGGGVHASGAYAALKAFSERYSIPVVTSLDGKGSVSEESPLSLGTIGANGGSPQANEFTQMADLLVVLGCKLDNVTTVGKGIFRESPRVIQVDLSDDVLANNVRADLPIMADIRLTLEALLTMELQAPEHTAWLKLAAEKRAEKLAAIEAVYARESDYVISAKVFESLQRHSGDNTIYVGDAGTPTPYVASYLRPKRPGRHSVLPRGHGALGYAIGAAIGACLADPGAKVVCLFGDASFGMSMGDLETIKRLNLPMVLVNFQNDCYGWIKTIQHLYYDDRYYGVDFSAVDSLRIAEGFGITGRNITRNDEVDGAIAWALSQSGPVFLNFMVEPVENFVPPVAQWETDAAKPAGDRKKLVY